MSNDKSLGVHVVSSQKNLSCTIFDKKTDKIQNERKSWELTVWILSKLFLPFFIENINDSYKRHNIPLKNLYSKMSLKVWIYRYFLAKLAKNCQKTSPLKRLQLSGMFYIGTRTWYHLGMQNTFPEWHTSHDMIQTFSKKLLMYEWALNYVVWCKVI